MNIVKTASIFMLAFFASEVAYADTDSQAAAWEYAKCIMQLKHLSKKQIAEIQKSNQNITDATNELGALSVQACRAEKDRLVAILEAKGNWDDSHAKAISQVEDESIYEIKIHTLKLMMHDRAQKQ